MVDFDRRWPLSSGNDRFRLLSVDFGRYQLREGERRRGRKIPGVLFSRAIHRLQAISLSASGSFSLHGEKEQGDSGNEEEEPAHEYTPAGRALKEKL
ncbi:hypothetical protein GW17_00018811 [Ensete ventricosum]|nr:hypothetical protein GW17_00018811 [Ensete ventricosum]RZS04699.1 hypothetical protein BHM03_00035076 [Ensete ventricosum]